MASAVQICTIAGTMTETPQQAIPVPAGMPFRAFLEGSPPLIRQQVTVDLSRESQLHTRCELALPTIELHCPQPTCSGVRFFDPTSGSLILHLQSPTSGYFG